MNHKWTSLQQLTSERAAQLGSAHEVQRFHRDVDETKDWIQEKDEALNNDDLGKDLRSVQALQRKHEGLERDLAALGDKVCLYHFYKGMFDLVSKWNPIINFLLPVRSDNWTKQQIV